MRDSSLNNMPSKNILFSMPLEIGEEKLFAIYKIKEKELNDSCVMRQINKNELNHKGELWYR